MITKTELKSIEEHIKAIKLYVEYDCCARAVIRELGYPSRNRLAIWYKEYQDRGSLDGYDEHKHLKYSHEQRQKQLTFIYTVAEVSGAQLRH